MQPKSEEQSKQMQTKQKIIDQETPTAKYGYSINNIMGFFKNGISKITDSIKKYDDERTEELTDSLTGNGQIWNKI
ncbi:TPA: hypothetical protein DCZ39_04480 [Patescibacteria group bacterium]|nr:hypothetical protein [Candidatus Gracilibacteria bacterium]